MTRRREAYERLEKFISSCYTQIHVTKKDFSEVINPFPTIDCFLWKEEPQNPLFSYHTAFYRQTLSDWYWYSKSLREEVNKMFGLLHNAAADFHKTGMQKQDLALVGRHHSPFILNQAIVLAKIYFRDLPNLKDTSSLIPETKIKNNLSLIQRVLGKRKGIS